ncbi:hypothetical protein KP509_08G057800 [Ceratopteris richardii]|nr:hypothetical protein KP509_08G057800 [Ceratopteris richardii]
MELSQSVLISSAYATAAVVIIYAQHISAVREVQPDLDLTNWGLGVFVIGIVGNFYHHYLLASLRSDKTKSMNSKSKYVVPQGGLFTYVVCPHYLFESVTFFGIAMMAQTFVALLTAVGMSSSLCARSYKTKDWYLKKVEGFPPNRKPFFPFLF